MISEIYGKEYIKSLKYINDDAFKEESHEDIIQKLQEYNAELLIQNEQLTKQEQEILDTKSFAIDMFYNAPICYIMIDKEFNILQINTKAYIDLNIDQYSPYKNLFRLVKNRNSRFFTKSSVDYKNYILEFEINGKIRYFNTTKKTNSSGNMFVTLTDVTFSRKKKAKLREEASKFKSLLEYSTDLKRYQNELILNTKSATMGNMLDAIAHQWTQTLNEISLYNSTIDFEVSNDMFEKNSILDRTKSISESINHMSDTLGEFRSFMRPDIKKVDYKVSSQIKKAISLTKAEMKISNIDIVYINKNDFTINGYPNQFVHVILNLINNSKYEFNKKNIKNKNIKIINSFVDGKNKIYFLDNAGGIPEDILPNIFENNISTKGDKGSGMGLFLTNLIIENHNGTIQAKNSNEGALFEITFK